MELLEWMDWAVVLLFIMVGYRVRLLWGIVLVALLIKLLVYANGPFGNGPIGTHVMFYVWWATLIPHGVVLTGLTVVHIFQITSKVWPVHYGVVNGIKVPASNAQRARIRTRKLCVDKIHQCILSSYPIICSCLTVSALLLCAFGHELPILYGAGGGAFGVQLSTPSLSASLLTGEWQSGGEFSGTATVISKDEGSFNIITTLHIMAPQIDLVYPALPFFSGLLACLALGYYTYFTGQRVQRYVKCVLWVGGLFMVMLCCQTPLFMYDAPTKLKFTDPNVHPCYISKPLQLSNILAYNRRTLLWSLRQPDIASLECTGTTNRNALSVGTRSPLPGVVQVYLHKRDHMIVGHLKRYSAREFVVDAPSSPGDSGSACVFASAPTEVHGLLQAGTWETTCKVVTKEELGGPK
eukprot:TRINITY_DN3842_c0_g1_i1.p1 TRINITY_DN3842_c0_g1~~TRINITY_DN3842_c0_g1_i1.p1  ORF type:complete len:409 (+),score=4.62 TRINITY_DN3842_c0_g1_i1:38-1264(+)